MEHVLFEPWKGRDYKTGGVFGKKILAIGESFYCSDEDIKKLPEGTSLTDKVVKDYLAIRNGEFRDNNGRWTNTYLKFERSLKGKKTTPEDSQEIWNSIAFYNYLQVPMSGARESGTPEDYKESENAFFEVIEELQPELIIVWGVTKLFYSLPEEKWTEGEDLIVDGNHVKNGYYQLKNEKSSRLIAVYHPSTGYSWNRWHKVISSQF